MRRLWLAIAAVVAAGCDDPFPAQCKTNSDCLPGDECYLGFCVIQETPDGGGAVGSDARVPDSLGADGAGLEPDASVVASDAAADGGQASSEESKDAGAGDVGSPPTLTWKSTTEPATFQGVWGFSLNDVWVAGKQGRLLHWDGTFWSDHSVNETDELNAIWGAASDDVWALGFDSASSSGLALHWDGAQWSRRAGNTENRYLGMSGNAGDDIWAVSEQGYLGGIHHWDGRAWKQSYDFHRGAIYAVSCLSPTVAWAAGDNGGTYQWDGTAWRAVADQKGGYGVLVEADNDVTVAGLHQDMHYWDGASWSSSPLLGENQHFGAIFSLTSSNAWAVGTEGLALRRAQGIWNSIATGTGRGLHGIWGRSGVKTFLWVVGNGVVLFNDLADVYPERLADRTPDGIVADAAVLDIASSKSGDVLAINEADILRWDPLAGVWRRSSRGATVNPSALRWSAAGVPWAIDGLNDIYSRSEDQWTLRYTSPKRLTDLWASPEGGVWASGWDGLVLQFDGETWKTVATGSQHRFERLSGTSDSNVWAVANSSTQATGSSVWHFDGKQWTSKLVASSVVNGLWAAKEGDVWAVGTAGSIFRYDGTTDSWTGKTSGTQATLNDVWGSSSDDVWFAGEYGTLLHWDGRAVAAVRSGTTSHLHKLTGSKADDVWVGGDHGTILHFTR